MKTISFVRVLSSIVLIGLLGIAMYYVAQPPPNLPSSTASVDAQTDPVLAQPTTPTQVAQVQQSITATQATTKSWQIVNIVSFDGVTQPDCYPEFAPQGDRYLCNILGDKSGERELWLGSLTNGLAKKLLDRVTPDYLWTADGERIIYANDSFPTLRSRQESEPLYILDIETNESRKIGNLTAKGRIQALPTGKVGFIQNQDIILVNIDQNQRNIQDVIVPIQPQYKELRSENNTEISLWFDERLLFYDAWYQFSPDSQYVLIAENIDHRIEVQLVDIANNARTIVFTSDDPFSQKLFAWSANSSQFIYTTESEDNFPQIWMMDVNEKQPQLIWKSQERGSYYNLAWEANDSLIFFEFLPSGTHNIPHLDYYILQLEYGVPQRILSDTVGVNIFDGGSKLLFTTAELINNNVIYRDQVGELTSQ